MTDRHNLSHGTSATEKHPGERASRERRCGGSCEFTRDAQGGSGQGRCDVTRDPRGGKPGSLSGSQSKDTLGEDCRCQSPAKGVGLARLMTVQGTGVTSSRTSRWSRAGHSQDLSLCLPGSRGEVRAGVRIWFTLKESLTS